MQRDELVRYLNERLNIAAYRDSSVNGLQVEGSREVERVALVTDAALSLFERAAAVSCDMIIAHHGIIWGGLSSITGRTYAQLKLLFDHNLNLYASHLPLDAHPELGNNAELARIAQLTDLTPFGKYDGQMIGFCGRPPRPLSLKELSEIFRAEVGGAPLMLPFGKALIETVGIVSGGGSSSLAEAVDRGIDCLVTGDGRHENHHFALESNINVIYLGHYHSETPGVKAVGRELTEKFGLDCTFIDEPTLL
jgi:dinuclear metal center YbgI/SA1388 family protein